jgi:hypothetical protein
MEKWVVISLTTTLLENSLFVFFIPYGIYAVSFYTFSQMGMQLKLWHATLDYM